MIDLHLHLDGSLSPALARDLAAAQGLPAPDAASLRAPADCRDLNHYLARFDLPLTLLQTAPALTLAARDLAARLARQGLLYAEVRFAPQLHTRRGLTQNQAVEAVCRGLAGGEAPAFGAQAILCCMRGGDPRANRETVDLAARWLGQGVCAADLAGAEALYPTAGYRELFAQAAGLGVPFTLHAGEAAGPESVWAALDLGASRVGHGVRSLGDPALMERLAATVTPLELCPTSNAQTHAVEGTFPLAQFLSAGIAATVNTDNMTVSGTTLLGEYRALGVDAARRQTLLDNAARAAFLPRERRQELAQAVRDPANLAR